MRLKTGWHIDATVQHLVMLISALLFLLLFLCICLLHFLCHCFHFVVLFAHITLFFSILTPNTIYPSIHFLIQMNSPALCTTNKSIHLLPFQLFFIHGPLSGPSSGLGLQCFLLACLNQNHCLTPLPISSTPSTFLPIIPHSIYWPDMDYHPNIWLINSQPKCIAGYNPSSICTTPLLLDFVLFFGTPHICIIHMAIQFTTQFLDGLNAAAVHNDLGWAGVFF